MIAETPVVIVAVAAIVMLAFMIGLSGGWRRVPRPGRGPATGPDSAAPGPGQAMLFELAWRARVTVLALRTGLLIVIGLTPLGARFVRALAPAGGTWRITASWLVIIAALTATGIPGRLAARRARALNPAIFRPRLGRRRRLITTLVVVLYLPGACALLAQLPPAGTLVGLAAGATIALLISPLFSTRLSKLPRSDRVAAALGSLPRAPGRAPLAVSGWVRQVANAGAVSMPDRGVIIFAPPLAAALTDRQLRAVTAHELAHLLRHDVARRRIRAYLMLMGAGATAVALHAVPALRGLAGLPAGLSAQSVPFLAAASYLVFRVLSALNLRAVRAEERAADRRMLTLTADRDACIEGTAVVQSVTGVPAAWTRWQRLLGATHPAARERDWLLRTSPAGEVENGMATAS